MSLQLSSESCSPACVREKWAVFLSVLRKEPKPQAFDAAVVDTLSQPSTVARAVLCQHRHISPREKKLKVSSVLIFRFSLPSFTDRHHTWAWCAPEMSSFKYQEPQGSQRGDRCEEGGMCSYLRCRSKAGLAFHGGKITAGLCQGHSDSKMENSSEAPAHSMQRIGQTFGMHSRMW